MCLSPFEILKCICFKLLNVFVPICACICQKVCQGNGAEPSPKTLLASPPIQCNEKEIFGFHICAFDLSYLIRFCFIPRLLLPSMNCIAIQKTRIWYTWNINMEKWWKGFGSLRYFANQRAFPFKENPSHMVSRQRQKKKAKDKDKDKYKDKGKDKEKYKDKEKDKIFKELFRSRRTLVTWSSPSDGRNRLNVPRGLVCCMQ